MTILEKLLQPVWEISPDPVVITGNEPDPGDRRILYTNRAFALQTGYSREEAVGRPAGFLLGPDTDGDALRASEEQLRTGKPHEYTLLHYRKDGSRYHCAITRAPLVDLDGTTEYLLSMYRPIAELRPAAPVNNDDTYRKSVPLTLPMPLREFPDGKLPQHLTSHPELDALLALWRNMRSTASLPDRRAFTLNIMTRWAPHLSIALVTSDGRFQFRLFGTELSNVYGHDLTGAFLDELTPRDLWSVVIAHYREVVETGEPLFAPISVSNGRWYNEVSRLLLPLSGDGDVNFIMGADYRRDVT